MQRKFLSAQTESLAELRQVRVICSTAAIDRAGEVIVQAGIDLGDYQANPIVLWQHDPNQPIAKAIEIGLAGGNVQATVQFPPEGISAKADEVYGLVGAGVINSVSIGFDPIETEPMDPMKPRGAQRYLKCGLMEFSFVSVPANPGAAIVARSSKPKTKDAPVGKIKSLYDVAELAEVLQRLGWIEDCAEWEAEWEQDNSPVPQMLADAMRALADALVAMTQEEVAELLAGRVGEDLAAEVAGLADDDGAYVLAGATPAIQKFRLGMIKAKVRQPVAVVAKAGKKLSAASEQTLKDAMAMHDEAADLHAQGAEKMKSASALLSDLLDSAVTSDTVDDPAQGDDAATDEAKAVTPPVVKSDLAARQRDLELLSVSRH